MGEDTIVTLFSDANSSNDANTEERGNVVIANSYPVMSRVVNGFSVNNEGESRLEPRVGLEFDSAEEARDFYSQYAARVGFKVRTGQLYRSRIDGSVSNRRYVCSKEGFQLNSRTGCPAFIRVQIRNSGKWAIDLLNTDHNHVLDPDGESHTPLLEVKNPKPTRAITVSHKPKLKLLDEVEDERPCPSGVVTVKRPKREDSERLPTVEPDVGLEFTSANEAYRFYQSYAARIGFRVRIGQLFRSKVDGSITSRRFVCSREGFQHPLRSGCGAYMRIKRQDSGSWIVDRHQKEHNHDVESYNEALNDSFTLMNSIEEVNDRFDGESFVNNNNGYHNKRRRESSIGSDWYRVLLEYFQTKQAEDTGFFHAVEVEDGGCRSVFWADSRSRFSASQFGDAVVLDTSYRKGLYTLPFAIFIGVNHHRQPVLLGCALIADESMESFNWLFRTYLRAMSDRHPQTIIADQDKAIQDAIVQVFSGTFHRFSVWQIQSREQEFFSSLGNGFKYEYEKCVYQSQTVSEFDAVWNTLAEKYGLKENAWLNFMHEKRESWVPLYVRRKFFAGIPQRESLESVFFGALLNSQTPLKEFVVRYERGLQRWREEERKEDLNCFNVQTFLQTSEPIEEQCRRLYTLSVFKVIQKELLQSYSYLGYKIFEEGTVSRYLLRKCGNENEKHVVTTNASDLHVDCTCLMFEYEGILCRHIFKVFQLLDIREVPSRYILHRWTINAQHGTVRDAESVGSSEELKNVMLWSLRETACKYVEAGAASLESYKLAYEIMREGGKKICWGR